MSADGLAALDRGVIDAGLTAAEAVARVEQLEKARAEQDIRIGLLEDRLTALFGAMAAFIERAGLDAEPFRKAERDSRLTVVPR